MTDAEKIEAKGGRIQDVRNGHHAPADAAVVSTSSMTGVAPSGDSTVVASAVESHEKDHVNHANDNSQAQAQGRGRKQVVVKIKNDKVRVSDAWLAWSK